jgi:hypothetical protein
MSKDIYGDIKGEVHSIGEFEDFVVYLYDGKNRYEPALILPNKLAVANLIIFLQRCLE